VKVTSWKRSVSKLNVEAMPAIVVATALFTALLATSSFAIEPSTKERQANISTQPAISALKLEYAKTSRTVAEHIIELQKFQLQDGTASIKPVIFSSVPDDLQDAEVSKKKTTFINTILPSVLIANHQIAQERQKLLQVSSQVSKFQKLRLANLEQSGLSSEDAEFILSLAKKYRAKTISDLQSRVQVTPPSLVIAQAALETGWGTSRAAKLANNLFGLQAVGLKNGLSPSKTSKGSTHKLFMYTNLLESVQHYMKNLNRHAAYSEFRKLRASGCVDSTELSSKLDAYSEIGGVEYSKRVNSVIRHSELKTIDQKSLQLAIGSTRKSSLRS